MVPCHRVVASDLSIGGFSGATSITSPEICNKVELLKAEGVPTIQGATKIRVRPFFLCLSRFRWFLVLLFLPIVVVLGLPVNEWKGQKLFLLTKQTSASCHFRVSRSVTR